MGYDEEFNLPVVTNWEKMNRCMFAEKCWVNPSDVNTSKNYEQGDFLRVWCNHEGDWCQANLGLDFCRIYQDHENE